MWDDHRKQNKGKLTAHTFLVLWHAIKDPLYQEMEEESKNIIKWACLLHNIGKVSRPSIEGKDHVSSFNSSLFVLNTMAKLELIDLTKENEERLFEVNRLIIQSR